VPKKTPPKPRPLYKSPPPSPKGRDVSPRRPRTAGPAVPTTDTLHATPIATAPFVLREDGTIETIPSEGRSLRVLELGGAASLTRRLSGSAPDTTERVPPIQSGRRGTPPSENLAPFGVPPSGGADTLKRGHQTIPPPDVGPGTSDVGLPRLIFRSDTPFLRLYHGNALELLDAIAAKYPDGRFDCIFADPPYFLSNGGITCHAGKMVKVDKGNWDKSRGPELNHEFNTEWLRRCQRVLKPHGTIWVTGTLHVIFSVGYAMQQLGFRILNDIAWEKPNPPPNLGCRCFTHSTETVLWAAKNEKGKHTFNYEAMKAVTGKQMKTVWRREEFSEGRAPRDPNFSNELGRRGTPPSEDELDSIWTMPAPGSDEKTLGKHPTQKPVALVERCLLASTNEGDLVLDPFLGGGTTAVACIRLKRGCVGIEMDFAYLALATKRADRQIVLIWLRGTITVPIWVSALK